MNQVKGPKSRLRTQKYNLPKSERENRDNTPPLRGLPIPNQTTGKETAGLRLEFFVPGYRR